MIVKIIAAMMLFASGFAFQAQAATNCENLKRSVRNAEAEIIKIKAYLDSAPESDVAAFNFLSTGLSKLIPAMNKAINDNNNEECGK